MKTLSKTLLIAALLATPFAAAQAREQSAHEAWLKAQEIDIKPTLKVTETQIPAGSETGASNSSTTTPGNTGANGYGATSEPGAPSGNMPSSSGGYAPAAPSTNMPHDGGSGYSQPGVSPGSGMRSQ